MNGYEAAAAPQAQQRSVSGSKSLEEALEEGNGNGVFKGDSQGSQVGRRSGGEVDDAGVAAAETDGPRPRIGINAESEIRWHVRLELALLKRYWPWVATAVGAEYVHLVAHNLIYYIEGIYYPDGPPPALKDLGLMLLADRLPESAEWVVGALTCTLVAMVLLLALARVTLKNVNWGGPQLEVVGHGDPAGSGRPRTVVAAPVAVVLKRTSQALALALILRVITFLVTMLPNPAEYCHGDNWNPPRTVGAIFARWAVEGSCGDLMFSGHTTHGMVLTLIIVRYAPGLRLIQGLAVSVMILLALALLAFKSHYTSDVVVAVYVSLMIWRLMPAEPARLDGDVLRIEEHGGVGANGERHTAVGSAASSPMGSVSSFEQRQQQGGEKKEPGGVVFADAREAPEDGDLEEGRGMGEPPSAGVRQKAA